MSVPGGVPLRPPPGWRAPAAPPVNPLGLAALVVFAMIVCGAAGWIAIRLPRRVAKPAPIKEKPSPPVEKRSLTYERDVLPIMNRACANCHGRMRKRGGVDLSTLTAVKRGGDNGPILKPGQPADSALLESITGGRMPPKLPEAVTSEERETIRAWIASGAR